MMECVQMLCAADLLMNEVIGDLLEARFEPQDEVGLNRPGDQFHMCGVHVQIGLCLLQHVRLQHRMMPLQLLRQDQLVKQHHAV